MRQHAQPDAEIAAACASGSRAKACCFTLLVSLEGESRGGPLVGTLRRGLVAAAVIRNLDERYQAAANGHAALRRRGPPHCTEDERRDFVAATAKAPREVRTFCGTLHATGYRISEALALTAWQVDLSGRVVQPLNGG